MPVKEGPVQSLQKMRCAPSCRPHLCASSSDDSVQVPTIGLHGWWPRGWTELESEVRAARGALPGAGPSAVMGPCTQPALGHAVAAQRSGWHCVYTEAP